MKRPMLYWVVMFVLGEVLIGVIPITVLVIIIATAFLFCLFKGNSFKESRLLLLLGLLFLFFGMVRAELERATISLCGYEDKSLVCFSGKLVSHDVNKGRYRVRVIQINDKPVRTNIWIECDDEIEIGSKINGSGIVREYMTATNYGQFDQKSYEYSKGNILFLTKVKINHIQKPVFPLRNYLAKINEYIGKQYDARLNESDASLAKAMVLGDKASLDQDILKLYQRNGIAHLIAISGLHIAMFGGVFYSLVRRISGSFKIAAGIGIAFIILYGMLTGLSGATVRAMIMLIMAIIADLFGRKYDSVTAISVALFIMLIDNPNIAGQAGFMLSFGAVTGIAVIYPVMKEELTLRFSKVYGVLNGKHHNTDKNRTSKNQATRKDIASNKTTKNKTAWENIAGNGITKRTIEKNRTVCGKIMFIIAKTADGLLVSICVNLMILPVIVYYYYEVPVYGVLLNIVVVPLMSVLLLALVGLGITGAFSDIFGIPAMACSYIAGIIFRCYEILCKLTDKLPYNTMCFGRPKIGWIIFYYVLLALMLIFTKKKRAVWAVYTLPFWVMLLIMPFFSKGLIVNMFDVGQGDGIYIKTPNNCNILIDSGSSSKKKVGDYIVKPGIKYYGAKRLDYVIVTHSDYDHYSGVMELLTAPDIEIGNFVLPAVNNPDDGYNELIKAADLKGCNIYKLQTGDRLVFDEVTFLCLNPEKKSYEDKNRSSIVLWMNYREFDMLFTGDMDSYIEKKILESPAFAAGLNDGNKLEVLKVSHHGSDTASSEEFLRAVNAEISLISVGSKNKYGHPSPKVMERLSRCCGSIYETKDKGAIRINTDGKKYYIDTYIN